MSNFTRHRPALSLVLAVSLWAAFAVGVLAAPGDLDPSFGSGGVVDFSLTDDYSFWCVAQQTDGKLLVAGFKSLHPNPARLVLRRHNADGSLDTSFGSGGEAIAEFTSSFPYVRRVHGVPSAVLVHSDGKIVVVGYTQVQSDDNQLAAVWRFTPTGLLDTTFDGDGVKEFLHPSVMESRAIDVKLSAGKALVLYRETKVFCCSFPTGYTYSHLARLNSNGSLDTSFASTGDVQLNSSLIAFALAVNPVNGLIYVGGDVPTQPNNSSSRVYRYSRTGALDTSYGSGGSTLVPICNTSNFARSLAIQSDGKLVVGGQIVFLSTNGAIVYPSLSRLNTNGDVDNSFGIAGVVCLPCTGWLCPSWPSGQNGNGRIQVQLQSDSKIVALIGDSSYPFLQRRQTDGSEDTTFSPWFSSQGKTLDMLIQSGDGKIDVLAYTTNGYRLIRYLP